MWRFRRQHLPVILQVASTECAAACLAMVAASFYLDAPLEKLRAEIGAGRDGANARRIVQTARRFGLEATGVRIAVEQVELLPSGSILHWEFNHFVVFDERRRGFYEIIDPAVGRRRVSERELRAAFTGIALLFERAKAGGSPSRPRWAGRRYLSALRPEVKLFFRIVGASAILQISGLAVPLLTGSFVDRVLPTKDHHLLTLLCLSGAALLTFHGAAFLIRGLLLAKLRSKMDSASFAQFITHLVSLPYVFFQNRPASDLLMRLRSNAVVREIMSATALSALLDGGMLFGYGLLLLRINLWMSMAVAAIVFLQVIVFAAFHRKKDELLAETLVRESRVQGYQDEMINGIETLKSMGCEKMTVAKASSLTTELLNVGFRRARVDVVQGALRAVLNGAAPLLLLSLGTHLVTRESLTVGEMFTECALAAGFLVPFRELLATATELERAKSHLVRLEDVLGASAEGDGKRVKTRLRGNIRCESVSFRYDDEGAYAVADISLEVKAGQQVALVGRSGAGKSTLAKLLVGLYVPTSGQIHFDELNLDELDLSALRRQIGIVPQSPFLFGETIRNNICIGHPDCSFAEITYAARRAQIHDDVEAMPLKYETLLVDRGGSLSGGQRQRLALARALVGRPSLILLDEATSSLDAITETAIFDSLREIPDTTLIVIAHRLSTVVRSDIIFVIENGHIAARGSHSDLMKESAIYRELIAAQLSG